MKGMIKIHVMHIENLLKQELLTSCNVCKLKKERKKETAEHCYLELFTKVKTCNISSSFFYWTLLQIKSNVTNCRISKVTEKKLYHISTIYMIIFFLPKMLVIVIVVFINIIIQIKYLLLCVNKY